MASTVRFAGRPRAMPLPRPWSPSFEDGESGALKVARAEISALQAESPLRLAADSLSVSGLDLSLTRSLLVAWRRAAAQRPKPAQLFQPPVQPRGGTTEGPASRPRATHRTQRSTCAASKPCSPNSATSRDRSTA
jgi:hypothetical protein